ncbi:MAG: ADOP family duplicated permease [Acidobacteriota bacterium]|nr:ADOP family duplicated permease [Acidobacteriota bacterium]
MISHSLRMIGRSPGLAAVVIVSLGIGIGVNTAVFSWLQAVTLKPLPGVSSGASFLSVEPKADTGTYPGMSWTEYRDLVPQLQAVDELVAYRMAPLNVGEAGRTERTYALLVSGNYFAALGLRPAAGRFIRPDEADVAGAEPIVVLSYDYWHTRFGGSPDAIGQTLQVNDSRLTVVGVAPEGFQGTIMGLQFDLWVPATLAPVLVSGSAELESRSQRGYSAIGRLRAGATAAEATAQLVSAMSALAAQFPETNERISGELRPFWKAVRGPQQMFVTALGLLQGVMLLVLLAVCGNTANLVLARASSRYREVGVRLALGARPGSVIRLLLLENVLLGLLGAALGILIAWWGTEALRAMPAYGAFPVRFQTSLDGYGLVFAISLGIGSGLLFGAAPAWQLGRIDPQLAIRSGLKNAGRSTMRDGLMAAQCGLAVLVLVVAGLFFQGFVETRDTDPGFRTEGLLLATYDLGPSAPTDDYARQFAIQLLDRLTRVPAVESVAIANAMPMDIHGLPMRGFTIEGRAQTTAQQELALSNIVSPGYFSTMGIPLVAGDDFTGLSDRTQPPQVIVNEEFVRRFIAPADPIGRGLTNGGVTYTIAGVARNSIYEAFGEPPTPAFFLSYRDRPRYLGEVHLRARPGSETLLAAEVQRAVREIDASLPVYNIRTMAEHVDRNLFLRKIPARMFLIIAPLLLALVSMGIYAVVSYSVAHRTSEIGVRIALGATTDRVVRQIVKESMLVISGGVVLAMVVAVMVDLHLFAGGAEDVPMLVGVPVLLLGVAWLACWLPARRATLVDPLAALRSE